MPQGKDFTIAELNIDTKSLISDTESVLDKIVKLKDSQKELKKETDNLNKATEDQRKQFIENDASLKKLNQEYNFNKKILSETETQTKGLTDALNRENKSINQAQKNNKELRAIRNNLNAETKEGVRAIDEINKKIDENTEFIKDNVSALEQQKINIGNYASALDGVIPGLGGFVNGLKGSVDGIKGATASTKAFKAALISTGIGAIIVALGALVGILSENEKVMDKVNEVLAYMGAVIDTVVGRINQLINGFVELLSGNIDGVVKMANAMSGLADAALEAGSAAVELEKLARANATLNSQSELTISVLEMQQAAYEKLRDDATASFKQREDAAYNYASVTKKISDETVAIAQRELQEIQKRNQNIINSGVALTRAEQKELNDRVIALNQALAEQISAYGDADREINQLAQDRLERDLDILIDGFDNLKTINEQKIADDRFTFEERKAILEETNALADESFAKQVETLEEFAGRSIDIQELLTTKSAEELNQRIRNLGLSEIMEGRLLEVIRERRIAEQDLAVASADLQVEILEKQLAKEEELLKARLDREKELRDEFTQARLYAQDIRFQEQLQKLKDNNADEYDLLRAKLEQEFELEKQKIENKIKLGEASEKELALIEKRYSDARVELNKQEQLAKLSIVSSVAGDIASTLGEQSAIAKGLAIAQATINTYSAAAAALAPPPVGAGPVFGPILAGSAIVQGLLQVSKITSVQLPKFATGTKRVVGAGTETSDSVPAMLSINERVVDAQANKIIGYDMDNQTLATAAVLYRKMTSGAYSGLDTDKIVKAINKSRSNHSTAVHVSDGMKYKIIDKDLYN